MGDTIDWRDIDPMQLGEPVAGKTYLADGWVYRDMPGKLSHELWDSFIELLGEGNYVILIMSESPDWKRGQLLISPDGMKNLAAFNAPPHRMSRTQKDPGG